MKFTVSSTALLNHMHAMRAVTIRNSRLPILEYFLFQLTGAQLTVTASDLETTLTTTIPVEGKADGMIALPAGMLVKALKVLPAQHLTIDTDKGFRARITCDQGIYTITGADPGEFPKTTDIAAPTTFTIPASALSKGIAKTMWVVGHDDLRPVIMGVNVELEEDCTRFAATDAHRLVVHTCTGTKHSKAASFILPAKCLKVLMKYLPNISTDVTVAFDQYIAFISFGNIVVRCRLIDGKYPRYTEVVPKELPNRITVDRMPLLFAMRRMQVFSNRITKQVRFTIEGGTVSLRAEDLDVDNNATEKLACAYDGVAMSIGFNTRFLIEVLKNMNCEQVVMKMDKPNRAALIVDAAEQGEDNTWTLVMPVMLND